VNAPAVLDDFGGEDGPVWDEVGRWVYDVAAAGVERQFAEVRIAGRLVRVTVEEVAR
jgi:hypothetical protein